MLQNNVLQKSQCYKGALYTQKIPKKFWERKKGILFASQKRVPTNVASKNPSFVQYSKSQKTFYSSIQRQGIKIFTFKDTKIDTHWGENYPFKAAMRYKNIILQQRFRRAIEK